LGEREKYYPRRRVTQDLAGIKIARGILTNRYTSAQTGGAGNKLFSRVLFVFSVGFNSSFSRLGVWGMVLGCGKGSLCLLFTSSRSTVGAGRGGQMRGGGDDRVGRTLGGKGGSRLPFPESSRSGSLRCKTTSAMPLDVHEKKTSLKE